MVSGMTVIVLVSIDTSFMYIITCLGIVKLYQTRHPDIVANAHLVFTGFAVIIFLAMIGVVSGSCSLKISCDIQFVCIHKRIK